MTETAPALERPWKYKPKDLVWHYTDGSALKSMLTHHELWASNTAFMNDSGELRLADKYLRQARDKMGDKFPRKGSLHTYLNHIGDWDDNLRHTDPYAPDGTRHLLSASKRGDTLTMWRGYTGTDALSYAIGLDRRETLKVLAPAGTDRSKIRAGRNNVKSWFDVSYDPQLAERRAKQAVKEILAAYDAKEQDPTPVWEKITEWTELLRDETKHEGFIHEEETRITADVQDELVRYRPGKWGMVPYIALTGSDGSPDPVSYEGRQLPIREIYISPGADRSHAVRSLNALLESCGYGPAYYEPWHDLINRIKVNQSAIPFR